MDYKYPDVEWQNALSDARASRAEPDGTEEPSEPLAQWLASAVLGRTNADHWGDVTEAAIALLVSRGEDEFSFDRLKQVLDSFTRESADDRKLAAKEHFDGPKDYEAWLRKNPAAETEVCASVPGTGTFFWFDAAEWG